MTKRRRADSSRTAIKGGGMCGVRLAITRYAFTGHCQENWVFLKSRLSGIRLLLGESSAVPQEPANPETGAIRSSASFKPSFAPDVPRALASNAALDGRKSRTGRRSRGIRHRFPRGIRTTHYHSQNIACWPFLSRDSQLHLANFLFQR